jgi:chromosome segregation ATPase
LRSKERSNQTQIAALESEIAKVQKILDNSRTMYNSLQKQYQEQLSKYYPVSLHLTYYG